MEERVARLEATVEHIQSDVSEIKIDLRRLSDKVDGMNESLGEKIDELRNSLASAKIGALLFYFAQTAALLGVMAKGFGWLK